MVDQTYQHESRVYSASLTATSDGLTTGLIPAGVGFVSVTSASANNIITLPPAADVSVGYSVEGWVGANGCEMRTDAASGETINGVDSDGTNEAAIPATHYFKAIYVDTDTWVLLDATELGTVGAAGIIPDTA